MFIDNISKDDYIYLNSYLDNELFQLTSYNKYFYNKYKINMKPYKISNPSIYEDCVFVILIYKSYVILFDNAEEYFSVGLLSNEVVSYNGTFTSLNECIEKIKSLEN